MSYWVVMFDRNGREQDPEGEGPFDCQCDAESHAEFALDSRWVTAEIQRLTYQKYNWRPTVSRRHYSSETSTRRREDAR